MTEKRRHSRFPVERHTQVFWTGAQGQFFQETAKIVEASASGVRLELRSRIADRTNVNLRVPPGSTILSGSVRHVRQRGLIYLTGIELPNPESLSRG